MEINQHLNYLQAKRQVKRMKGFYIHLAIFVFVNGISVLSDIFDNDGFQINHNLGLIIWTIGLTFHGLSVFLPNFIFGKDWEERKIREIMDKNHQPK